MAAAAALAGGCLTNDLRQFLSIDYKVQGAQGYQMLRKLLSICTGKCESSSVQVATAPQDEGEEVASTKEQNQHSCDPQDYTAAHRSQANHPAIHCKPASSGSVDCQPLQLPEPARAVTQQHSQQLRLERRRRRSQPRRLKQQQQQAQKPSLFQQQIYQQLPSEQSVGGDAVVDGGLAQDSDAALCGDLLEIIRREGGVVLALALHALHIWAQAKPARVQTCLGLGAVPVLLQVLEKVLGSSTPSKSTSAYAASLAVILLRMLSRSGEEGMAAVVAAGGLSCLLRLLPLLHEDRALCLALYLLSDLTRRSAGALDQAVEAGGVRLVVGCLSRPLGESTKFAALLINRWSLLAPLGEQFRSAGALDSLLDVLRSQHGALAHAQEQALSPLGPGALLSEVSAYSLSALAILGQEDAPRIRALLSACPSSLAAVTMAMTHYERSFQGTGFPHALLASLLEGDEGGRLAAQVVARPDLLPSWLTLRRVGWQLVDRASRDDALQALEEMPAEVQGSVTHSLTRLLEHSRSYVAPLASRSRLLPLFSGAIAELAPTACAARDPEGSLAPRMEGSCPETPSSPSLAFEGSGAALHVHVSPLCPSINGRLAFHTKQADSGSGADVAEPAHAPSGGQSCSRACAEAYEKSGTDSGDAPLHGEDAVQQTQQKWGGGVRQAGGEDGEEMMRRGSIAPEVIVRMERPGAGEADEGANKVDWASKPPTPAPMPAPNAAALQRLLMALATMRRSPGAGALTPAPGKRQLEDAAGPDTETQAAKRRGAVFAFTRADVNVQRYDTLALRVGGREFHAVGFVLEAHSPLLRSLLGTLRSLQEALPIPCVAGFDPDRMYSLFGWAVEYCYTGAVQGLTPEGALDLWTLAEYLQMDGLQRECEAVLSKASLPAGVEGMPHQRAQQGTGARGLLSVRYVLGLGYPSGERLRLGVAREVLERLVGGVVEEGEGGQEGKENQRLGGVAVGGKAMSLLCHDAELATLVADHPAELAADLACALAEQLKLMCC